MPRPLKDNQHPSQPSWSNELQTQQPEVLAWLCQHLQGHSLDTVIEVVARYFETTQRWGDVVPMLRSSRLNLELSTQVATIDPGQRWISELPVSLDPADKWMVGRLLRALVSVTQSSV